MDVELKIAALEQLLVAMLKDSTANGSDPRLIKRRAQAALMGSDGPGGPDEKVKASEYLDQFLGK